MKRAVILATVLVSSFVGGAVAQQQFRPSDAAVEQFTFLWFEVIKKDLHGLVGFRTYNTDMAVILTAERVRLAEAELALATELHKMAIETRDKARPEPTQ